MVFVLREIVDMAAMSLIVGFLLKDLFVPRKIRTVYEPLDDLKARRLLQFQGLGFSIAATAPAIILHELGHKFMAMYFGMTAVFKAAYGWMFLGLILKMMTGFIFFVPAYVQISGGNTTPLQFSAVAFAGPAVNLVLWLSTWFIYRNFKISKKHLPLLVVTSKINMLLFIFNMLPIPGFDGSKVFYGLLQGMGLI